MEGEVVVTVLVLCPDLLFVKLIDMFCTAELGANDFPTKWYFNFIVEVRCTKFDLGHIAMVVLNRPVKLNIVFFADLFYTTRTLDSTSGNAR